MRMWLFLISFFGACPLIAEVQLALNWKPEPQFGGFYAVTAHRLDKEAGLELAITPGGAGTPTVQMVAAGTAQFGVVSADEVVIARDRGMPIVALMAVFQTNPQGIMTHGERQFSNIADVFKKGGTLAIQKGLGYSLFLEKKFGFGKIKVVPYAGGIAPFLADPNFSQQCFVTSEPILAKKQGKNPKTFLVADAGYNPYTTVVVTRADTLEKNPALVATVTNLFRKGWEQYLKDASATNIAMNRLNPTMDMATFVESAEAQRPLIESGDAKMMGLGAMTEARWGEIGQQLKDLGLVKKVLDPKLYFWKPIPKG